MNLEEIEIANPESAARIVDPGSTIRAFLLIRNAGRGYEVSAPFLLWGIVEPIETGPKRPTHFPCDCTWVFIPDERSWKEWADFCGFPSPGVAACSCQGQLLE
jgi:hypothetical protein